MLSNRIPFQTNIKKLTMKAIILSKVEFKETIWGKISSEAKDLIYKMLEKEESRRIKSTEILSPMVQMNIELCVILNIHDLIFGFYSIIF